MDISLKNEISNFKKWALAYLPETRSGEWECDYEHWNELYTAFNNFIESNSPENATKQDIANIIYAIARDNEQENFVFVLSKKTNWFKAVLSSVLECNEPDAKWQFAATLGDQIIPFKEAEAALLRLVSDENEYVSRRALQSLGRIGSNKAESLCERAWDTNHVYQRIMSLWVLKEIQSAKLTKYLSLAKEDGRESLVINANKIENA
jgi:hypothetical protein